MYVKVTFLFEQLSISLVCFMDMQQQLYTLDKMFSFRSAFLLVVPCPTCSIHHTFSSLFLSLRPSFSPFSLFVFSVSLCVVLTLPLPPRLTRPSFFLRTLEGQLYKWTNAFKGWQPRWFSVDHDQGVLHYYTVSRRGSTCGLTCGCGNGRGIG